MGETPAAASAGRPSPVPPPPPSAADLAEKHLESLAPIFDKDKVFDCIAWVCFGIKDVSKLRVVEKDDIQTKRLKKSNGARIGKVASWLGKNYPDLSEEHIAAKVRLFKQEWKKTYSIPRDEEKFSNEWLAWEQAKLPDPIKSNGNGAWSLTPVTGGPLRNAKGFSQEELDAAKARAKEGVLS